MQPVDYIKHWFERDVKIATWNDVEILESTDYEATVLWKTPRFTYTISVDHSPGVSYLACTFDMNNRYKGGELPHGDFSEDTWAKILHAITETELLGHRPQPRNNHQGWGR